MSCRQPVSRAAAKRVGTNIAILQKSCPMPLSLLTLSKLLLSVRQDSSPAADVHAGLFVLGYGWSSRARSGSWRTRADLEVCPTNCAAFLILGKLPTKDGLLVRNFGDLPRIQALQELLGGLGEPGCAGGLRSCALTGHPWWAVFPI